jgi:hypothetical protein
MAEQVQRIAQFGVESTPGTSVAATAKWAVDAATPELDRASQYGAEDYGRSIRNHAGRGYHGLRASQMPFAGDVTFEQIMVPMETHYAGGVVPTGTNPYTWVYTFEGGTSTRKTLTIEEGVPGSTQDEWEMAGAVCDDLTLEYDMLAAPGAQPWRMSGTLLAWDRAIASLTGSLTLPALETAMGHLTIIKEGTTATAFASLAENAVTLVRYSQTTNRAYVRRAYGAATGDKATGWGASEKATGTFEAILKVNASTKTNFHDIWNSSGGSLGERRWRIECVGSGTKKIQLDTRAAIFAVGIDDRDGERVYAVTGERVDDDTLSGMQQATIINTMATITA